MDRWTAKSSWSMQQSIASSWRTDFKHWGIFKALELSPGYSDMDHVTGEERVNKLMKLKEFLLACRKNDVNAVASLWPDASCPIWPTETHAFVPHGFTEAASNGANEVILYFVTTAKIDVNSHFDGGGTPLMCAANGGTRALPSTVKLLLELGADPLHKSHKNTTSLDKALSCLSLFREIDPDGLKYPRFTLEKAEAVKILQTHVPRLTHLCRAAVREAVIKPEHFYEESGITCVNNDAIDSDIKAGLADFLPESLNLCNNAVANPLDEIKAIGLRNVFLR